MKKGILGSVILLIGFVYINNSSLWIKTPEKPWLLAHRGLGQTFSMEGITNETCTAKRIDKPEHPYLENTIPSMKTAFAAGAAIVELDIHPTTDHKFAVFHDWTLDCRTNGRGVTREHSMERLKTLDIGYGYTADGGKTFPFRGKGVGLMPTLSEVFLSFPDRSFLIHIKSNDPKEGELLAEYLSTFSKKRLAQLGVYGGDQPIARLRQRLPHLRVMSKATLMKDLLAYIGIGWTGYVPKACRGTLLLVPEKIAPWLWGWPARFIQRMKGVDTQVILVAGSGKFSEGFDTVTSLRRIPPKYSGGIWTNRIDRTAPIVLRRYQSR